MEHEASQFAHRKQTTETTSYAFIDFFFFSNLEERVSNKESLG